MHVPEMAGCFSATEGYFRDHGTLAKADKEMIILAVARELGARYPWSRHEIRAREVGVRGEAPRIATRQRTSGCADTARKNRYRNGAQSTSRAQAFRRAVGRAQAELGVGPLVEAVGLVGHYNFISMVAKTFDLDVPPGTVTF